MPPNRPDGTPWPRISIVTPSYNQRQFIEETIRSVLLQGYPDLEYIIIDGGSTDGAVDVIRRYEPWLKYWESEKDRGQPHAINKGYALSTGAVFQWINSDDLLCKGALKSVAEAGGEGRLVAGGVVNFGDDTGEDIIINRNLTWRALMTPPEPVVFHQPGVFLPTNLLKSRNQSTLLSEKFQYIFDWKLIIELLGLCKNDVTYVSAPLVRFRLHSTSKTCAHQDRFADEHRMLYLMLSQEAVDRRLGAVALECHRRIMDQTDTNLLLNSEGNSAFKVASLLSLAAKRPRVMTRRFYWGAMRRTLTHANGNRSNHRS